MLESGPAALNMGRSFFNVAFGTSENPSLFSFGGEITSGTLSGTIPEMSFDFPINPGGQLNLVFNVNVGAEAQSIPEPVTSILCGLGVSGLALLARRRQSRRSPGHQPFGPLVIT
jgi:hypothetical protein